MMFRLGFVTFNFRLKSGPFFVGLIRGRSTMIRLSTTVAMDIKLNCVTEDLLYDICTVIHG